ncbi:hypothetical protein K0M31_008744 [Melipona bicolor]|uniref:Uncharacterized protein n=1 Tax=Melipona bicolor TaxID=60889 RepID=A0AA40FQP8_9HYME|nr:hypothetical protein K0M31_008744 [Melipona bicolor]
MFPRAVLLLLLSSTVLCLTDLTTKTAIKETSTMSQSAILLTVTVCVTAPVMAVLLPMLIYYKCCGQDLRKQIV